MLDASPSLFKQFYALTPQTNISAESQLKPGEMSLVCGECQTRPGAHNASSLQLHQKVPLLQVRALQRVSFHLSAFLVLNVHGTSQPRINLKDSQKGSRDALRFEFAGGDSCPNGEPLAYQPCGPTPDIFGSRRSKHFKPSFSDGIFASVASLQTLCACCLSWWLQTASPPGLPMCRRLTTSRESFLDTAAKQISGSGDVAGPIDTLDWFDRLSLRRGLHIHGVRWGQEAESSRKSQFSQRRLGH